MRRRATDRAAVRIAVGVPAAALALVLAGCGQKGPLYLPSAQQKPVPAAPTGTAPQPRAPASPQQHRKDRPAAPSDTAQPAQPPAR